MVGSNPDEMLSQGFTAVGKDFPVFLHPQNQARIRASLVPSENQVQATLASNVTLHRMLRLEEDLIRRDLTINAMAQAEDGTLIDPYGGQRDLNDRISTPCIRRVY